MIYCPHGAETFQEFFNNEKNEGQNFAEIFFFLAYLPPGFSFSLIFLFFFFCKVLKILTFLLSSVCKNLLFLFYFMHICLNFCCRLLIAFFFFPSFISYCIMKRGGRKEGIWKIFQRISRKGSQYKGRKERKRKKN